MLRHKSLLKLFRRLSVVAVSIPVLCLAADRAEDDGDNPKHPGNAAVRAETDDATRRRDAQRDLYETPLTPDYMKFLNRAAARERARNGSMLPITTTNTDASGTTTVTTNAAVTGTTWTNLGPAKADYIKNGGITLNKTDAGRPKVAICAGSGQCRHPLRGVFRWRRLEND